MRLASHPASTNTSSVPSSSATASAANGLVCIRLVAKPTPIDGPPAATAIQSQSLPSAATSGRKNTSCPRRRSKARSRKRRYQPWLSPVSGARRMLGRSAIW